MIKKHKKILFISLGSIALIAPIVTMGTILWIDENNSKHLNEYKNLISNVINTPIPNINSNFIKGMDVSSYADVIENFLFQNNIKKPNGEWYTYKDVANPNEMIWDDNKKEEVSLSEYIDDHLFSYFDQNSNRVYANMFEILHDKGINSIRLRLWVDPYTDSGEQYGGGHNDLNTTIFIINEAKKHGFDDFLLDIQYSDFWADPSRQYIPKSWSNLSQNELIQKGYDYTYQILDQVYSIPGINEYTKIRVQFGNEIDYGLLWDNSAYRTKNYDFSNKFILKCANAINDFTNSYNIKHKCNIYIDKSIHFGSYYPDYTSILDSYNAALKVVDTIQLSNYVIYLNGTFNDFVDKIQKIQELYPNKKIVLGEVAIPYSSIDYGYLNDGSSGFPNHKKPKYVDWSPEIQALIMSQYMQIISQLLPNIETGFYWWEPAYLYVGRSTWSTKSGLQYLSSKNSESKKYSDISNWSLMGCFDRNGIALPVLDVINSFSRTNNQDIHTYEPKDIVHILGQKDTATNIFYKSVNVKFNTSDFQKQDLSKIFYSLLNENPNNSDIDLDIYLNQFDFKSYLKKYSLDAIIEYIFVYQLHMYYDTLMWDQVNISNFSYDQVAGVAKLSIESKPDSFYYTGTCTFTAKIHNDYYSNSIDLTDSSIEINKNDNNWFKVIINILKSQPNYGFENQIWNAFGIKGGATDDNSLWLYDQGKGTDRNAEFFLLNSDNIFMYDNLVDFDVLNQNKLWIDNFSEYPTGENIIYFAIKKRINSLDIDANIPSTYEQVGKCQWKYTDLLVYKLKINVIGEDMYE